MKSLKRTTREEGEEKNQSQVQLTLSCTSVSRPYNHTHIFAFAWPALPCRMHYCRGERLSYAHINSLMMIKLNAPIDTNKVWKFELNNLMRSLCWTHSKRKWNERSRLSFASPPRSWAESENILRRHSKTFLNKLSVCSSNPSSTTSWAQSS